MTGIPLVVLDACVLANFLLCDTLLRLAEPPRLFEPKWSEEIIRETTRTLELKLGWPKSLTTHLEMRNCMGMARPHRRNPGPLPPESVEQVTGIRNSTPPRS